MTSRPVATSVRAAAVGAFAMIACQVAGKAVRDALFLSSFDVTVLPRMVVAAALVTIFGVLAAGRLLARWGPGRVVPIAFGVSGVLMIAIWTMIRVGHAPGIAAVTFYLHVAAFGAVLISWFWSMISERFDPRSARRNIGKIASGGTFGGLVGGLAAERAGALLPVPTLLPLLALLHFACALATRHVGGARENVASPRHAPGDGPEAPPENRPSGLRVLSEAKYLRHLALLVMAGTVAATILDYVFKVRADAMYGDDPQSLLRFFALFYTGVALITFLMQSLLTRRSLEHLGLARTVALLPFTVAAGAVAAFAIPGLAAIGAARGAEAAVRSSLFRSGYELFYTPIPHDEKRATKTIVDVGFDRLGDAFGAGIVQIVLLAGFAVTNTLLTLAVALATASFLIARKLQQGYVSALERSLLHQAGDAGAPRSIEDTGSFLQTMTHLDLTSDLPDLGADVGADLATSAIDVHAIAHLQPHAGPADGGTGEAEVPGAAGERPVETARPPAALRDPMLLRSLDLRSGNAARVQKALATSRTLPPDLVSLVIPLLAWDLVAPQALRALRRVVDRHAGQLVDSLLAPDEEFAIRRRIPRVLAQSRSELAVHGLLRALSDRRFEVRYQSGVALAKLHDKLPETSIDRERVLGTIERETRVDRRVWESHRLLDEARVSEESPFFQEVLRERSSRSLEHVFNMLSLVYPKRPLAVAYQGLHAEDQNLRGTALEYLESILPPSIQEALWPFLDESRAPPDLSDKSREEILDSLLRSHDSIQLNLEEIRNRSAEGDA